MIFVSYSWINQKPDHKVLKLVNDLRKLGYETKCDVMDIQNNSSINFFEMMSQNLSASEKVIIVLSPEYKDKADSFNGGVGTEFRYIISEIEKNINKYIFVSLIPLTDQNRSLITPSFLSGREIIDLTATPLATSRLLNKLTDTPEYVFNDINPTVVSPTPTYFDKPLQENEKIKTGFEMFSASTPFFDYRIRSAFPGVRGLQIFEDPKTCIDRLEILLRQPLSHHNLKEPIWYFRGSSCLSIPSFKRLSDTKCLIGFDEFEIEKIGVYIDSAYYRDFVYIQTKPEKPIGIYADKNYYEEQYYLDQGYYYEEFGLFGDIPISRSEYDDGAAVINDEVVFSNGKFELRARYLTPYNFVICAKFHPFNSLKGDEISKYFLNGILKGKHTIEDFVNASINLPRNPNDL